LPNAAPPAVTAIAILPHVHGNGLDPSELFNRKPAVESVNRRESTARRFFADWFRWATHSQLPEMISVAYTLKRHFANIITYIRKPLANAGAERPEQ
jgi:hypothetical protein